VSLQEGRSALHRVFRKRKLQTQDLIAKSGQKSQNLRAR
jgi:hypothetical protein